MESIEENDSSLKPDKFRSGFAGIIGRPNVGKSTLLNALVRKKIAIISDKPQTTRHKIRCVVNQKDAQVVFIDTPGFHKPKDELGRHLNKMVKSALDEVDVVVFMVDASQSIGTGDCYIANELLQIETPVILVLNKKDLIDQTEIDAQLEVGKHLGEFADIVTISAASGEGVDELLEKLTVLLPQGPKYYPSDMLTDQPEKTVIAEFIREKAIEVTHEEVPYSIAVEVDEVKKREDKELIDVYAVLYIEKESQKGIIIGKGGKKLKEIGTRARKDIQNLLGSQVYLDIRVKVKKDWRKDEKEIHRFGYNGRQD